PEYPYGCKATASRNEPVDDPHRLARSFIGRRPWIFWNGIYFKYTGTKYQQVPEHEVRAALNGHMKQCFEADYAKRLRHYRALADDAKRPAYQSVSHGSVTNALEALQSLALVSGTTKLPSWRDKDGPANCLAFENGLLDLDTLEMQPHTQDWFST